MQSEFNPWVISMIPLKKDDVMLLEGNKRSLSNLKKIIIAHICSSLEKVLVIASGISLESLYFTF